MNMEFSYVLRNRDVMPCSSCIISPCLTGLGGLLTTRLCLEDQEASRNDTKLTPCIMEALESLDMRKVLEVGGHAYFLGSLIIHQLLTSLKG